MLSSQPKGPEGPISSQAIKVHPRSMASGDIGAKSSLISIHRYLKTFVYRGSQIHPEAFLTLHSHAKTVRLHSYCSDLGPVLVQRRQIKP